MIATIILIFIICIIIFIVFSEKIFERTNFYKIKYCETNKLKNINRQVDYVNTGSTFAFYGIDYNAVDVEGINLALCPQSLESDFIMLQHFEKYYKPGATIFIVISDLAFAKKEYKEAKTKDKYYKVLGMKEIEDYNILRAIRAKYFPVLYDWKNFLRFHWDIKDTYEYELKVNENDKEAVEADAYKRCKDWMQEFALKNLQDPYQAEKYAEEFSYTTGIVEDMITWCKKKGYKPLIVNLPVSFEMKRYFSDEFLSEFYYKYVYEISKEYDVKFINLQKNTKLSDYLLYLDSCRLNKPGREIITTLLLEESQK